MISEGSCDTEDWSNDAENSDLITEINYILKYIQIENSFFIVIIFYNITEFTVYLKKKWYRLHSKANRPQTLLVWIYILYKYII